MTPESSPPPSPRDRLPGRASGPGLGWPRWMLWVVLGLVVATIALPGLFTSESAKALSYSEVITQANQGKIAELKYNNDTGHISGEFTKEAGEGSFESSGPVPLPDADVATLREKVPGAEFETPSSNFLSTWLPLLLPFALLILFFWWMS